MTIIGLSGYARTGKDSVASILVKERGFQQIAFADALREALIVLNPYIRYKGQEYIGLADGVLWYGWEQLKEHGDDVRGLLQRMGTDVGRNLIGEDVWVNATFKHINSELDQEDWVISDVRFPNEARAIEAADGQIWRTVRQDYGPVNNHRSEIALDEWPWDVLIRNNGSLDDLRHLVLDAVDDA